MPTGSADDLVDSAGRLMYASKQGGRKRVTGDSGTLTNHADKPILGTGIPWEMSARRT